MTTRNLRDYNLNIVAMHQYGNPDFRNCISFCPRMRTNTF